MAKIKSFIKRNMKKVVAVVMAAALLAGNVVITPKAASFPTEGGASGTLTYSNYFKNKTTAYTTRFGNHSMQKMTMTAANGEQRAAFCIEPGVGTYPGGKYTSSTVIDKSKAKYYRAAISFYYKEGKDAGYGDYERQAMTQAFIWFITKNQANASTFKSDTVSVFSGQGICSESIARNMYDLAKEVIIDNADDYTAQDVTLLKWTSSGCQAVLTGKVNEAKERYYRIKVEKEALKKDDTVLKDANLAGITYTLYTTRDGNTKVEDRNGNAVKITLNENGVGYSKYIEFDESKEKVTVYLAETSVKPGTELNEKRDAIEINKSDIPDGGKITVTQETENEAWYACFEVYKIDGKTQVPLDGAEFTVFEWDGKTYVNTGDKFKTDKDGFGMSKEHYYTAKNGGRFLVKETAAPAGYPVSDISKEFTITEESQGDHMLDWTAPNSKPETGSLIINKIDELTGEPIITGASFRVYRLVRNPDGYYINANTGDPFEFSPSIPDSQYYKVDCGLMTNVGNGVYKIDGLKTDEIYRVYEEKVPEGYMDPWILHTNNAGNNYWYTDGYVDMNLSSSEASTSYTWENKPLNLTLTLNKLNSKSGEPIEGAVFNLYEKMPSGEEVLLSQGITDSDGKIVFREIRIGEHDAVIREVYVPEGYILDSTPITITNEEIAEAGLKSMVPVHEYNYNDGSVLGPLIQLHTGKAYITKDITNEPVEKPIKIHKISKSRTGKEVKNLEGAEFAVYKVDGVVLTETNYETFDKYDTLTPVDTLITDKDGNAESKDLPIGFYAVVETKAPKNFLEAAPRLVEVDDSEVKAVEIEIEDSEFESRLRIVKKDADTGEIVKIAGAKFKVLNKDTNTFVKQTIYYYGDEENPDEFTSFEETDTFTTDETGTVVLPDVLGCGSYELIEVAEPKNYILDETPVPFTIDDEMDYEFDESTQDPIIEVVKENKGITGTITVNKAGSKVDSYDEENGFGYKEVPLPDVEFNIYAAEDIYMADGITKAYSKDELVDTLKTDKDGAATSKVLPLGKYRVEETKTLDGFYDEKIVKEVTISNDETNPNLNAVLSITNKKQDVEIKVYKKEEGTNVLLPAATFGVYAKEDILAIDGSVLVKKDTLIEKKTTDENGYVVFGKDKDYPVADYYVKELAAPKGFRLSKESIDVNLVGSPNTTATIYKEYVMYNAPTEVDVSKVDITSSEEIEGATLEVWYTDENGEKVVADTWVSTKEPHKIKYLEVGREYTLTEKIVAPGYVTAADVKFTVTAENKVQGVTMIDDYTKVLISKTDIVTGKPVIGAHLEIRDEAGNVVAEWITTDEPYYIEKLPIGKYVLVETLAPGSQGYVTAENVEFEVKDTGEIQKVEMKDDFTKVQILKTDIVTGDPVIGAHLEIRNEAGEVVASWVTTEDPHYLEYLPTGKYVLVETQAPGSQGYVTAENVEFEVKDTGEIQKVEMKDDFTKVSISKTNITGTEPVSGAKLKIVNAAGETVDEWISTDEPHLIEKLPVGHYTLIEVLAPVAYVKAESVDFDVTDTGEIVEVVMKDAKSVGRITLTKVDADNTSKTLEGTEFAILDKDGKQISTMKTDKNGVATSNLLDLDDKGNGTFYVQETKASVGYQLDDTKRKVEIKYENDTTAVITVDLGKVTNKAKKKVITPVTGVTSNPLPLIVFGLSGLCIAAVVVITKRRRRDDEEYVS